MKKEVKAAKIAELTEKIKSSSALLLADHRGLTVAETTRLRNELRAAGCSSFEVVKNTLTQKAADQAEAGQLKQYLAGPTAIAFIEGEAVETAKVLTNLAKELKSLEIKGGLLEGKLIDEEAVKFLASLPPREVLIAQVLGGLQGPIRGLATVLAGPMRGLVTVLTRIQEQKEAA